MPAADYQLFIVDMRAVPQYDPALSISGFLDFIDSVNGNQRRPVNPNEAIGELLGQRLEGSVEEIPTLLVFRTDVLLVRDEASNILNRYQLEVAVNGGAYVSALPFEVSLRSDLSERGAGEPRRVCQRCCQS